MAKAYPRRKDFILYTTLMMALMLAGPGAPARALPEPEEIRQTLDYLSEVDMPLQVTGLLLAALGEQVAATPQLPEPAELKETLAYLTEINMPVMTAACSALYPSMGGALEVMFPDWKHANQADIDTGRLEARARLKDGQTLETWEQETLAATKSQFEKLPRDTQEKRRFGLLALLSGK